MMKCSDDLQACSHMIGWIAIFALIPAIAVATYFLIVRP